MYNPYNWTIKRVNIGEEIANLDCQIARHRSEIDNCYEEIRVLNNKTNELFKRIDKIKENIKRKEKDKKEIWEIYKIPFCFDEFSWNE